jgi:hypothetical protein
VDAFVALFGGCHGGPDRKYQVVEATVAVTDPEHPACAGVKDFTIKDEFYYKLKFPRPDAGVRPVLRVTIDGGPETVAWVWERPDGGRSFGFSGLHFHENWKRAEYRRVTAQAILWSVKVPVPEGGYGSSWRTRTTDCRRGSDGDHASGGGPVRAVAVSGWRVVTAAGASVVSATRFPTTSRTAQRDPKSTVDVTDRLGLTIRPCQWEATGVVRGRSTQLNNVTSARRAAGLVHRSGGEMVARCREGEPPEGVRPPPWSAAPSARPRSSVVLRPSPSRPTAARSRPRVASPPRVVRVGIQESSVWMTPAAWTRTSTSPSPGRGCRASS